MALIFRAYYALIRNPRLTTKGKNTNAQFGFTNTLIELINKQKPSHMAVCFDTAAPTERHTDFAGLQSKPAGSTGRYSHCYSRYKKNYQGI